MNCENSGLNAWRNTADTRSPFLPLLLPHISTSGTAWIFPRQAVRSWVVMKLFPCNTRSVWSHGHISASPVPFMSCYLSKEQWKGAQAWGVDEYKLLKGARKKALQKQEDLSFKLQVRGFKGQMRKVNVKMLWCCLCCLTGVFNRGCCF